MELSEQVVSLELAQKLKELGVKQDSYFKFEVKINGYFEIYHSKATSCSNEYYAAFTVAELGNILPKTVFIKTEDEDKTIFSNFRLVTGRSLIVEEQTPAEFWTVNYICDTTNELRNLLFDPLLSPPIYDKNEATARAKMLMWLIENKLITVNE